MSATYLEAINEIQDIFKSAWDATGHAAVYENVDGSQPSTTAPWARVTVRHVSGGQASLANHVGVRRWYRLGIVTVQVFVPMGEGLSEAYTLSKIISDAYEGAATPSGVWFRNVRINEVGPDGEWYQFNVSADFTYDELR